MFHVRGRYVCSAGSSNSQKCWEAELASCKPTSMLCEMRGCPTDAIDATMEPSKSLREAVAAMAGPGAELRYEEAPRQAMQRPMPKDLGRQRCAAGGPLGR